MSSSVVCPSCGEPATHCAGSLVPADPDAANARAAAGYAVVESAPVESAPERLLTAGAMIALPEPITPDVIRCGNPDCGSRATALLLSVTGPRLAEVGVRLAGPDG